ncbi:MAG TPA: helix-hairpin-helix domain-containing protein [Candidatus Scybalocola faecigallinarum]|uniref:Helix-hairpin-helix domain-containing protein n=1 Tax=Candidatus Scybalocola faecigallinarum TaxID=2840941 RepID=A0A9D1F591_9FIRM|nr:helix-hairpin-helix domain-containing protein [Candidatus Scybalocola faecigallinarum]
MLKLSSKQKKWVMRLMAVFFAIVCGLAYHAGCSRASEEPLAGLETIAPLDDGGAFQSQSSYESGTEDESQAFASQNGSGSSPQESVCEEIYVYVCGYVQSPGVYALGPGARIYEAIEAAGGMAEEADASYVNLAQVAEDQMQIYIPSLEETASGTFARDTAGTDGSMEEGGQAMVNINTASADQLDALPGIGPSKAEDIINYREEHGGFSSVEELMDIPGIKSGIFDQIKDLVTVD